MFNFFSANAAQETKKKCHRQEDMQIIKSKYMFCTKYQRRDYYGSPHRICDVFNLFV